MIMHIIVLCIAVNLLHQNTYPMAQPLSLKDFELVAPPLRKSRELAYLKEILQTPPGLWENTGTNFLSTDLIRCNAVETDSIDLYINSYAQLERNHRSLIELLVACCEHRRPIGTEACQAVQENMLEFMNTEYRRIGRELNRSERNLTKFKAIANVMRMLMNQRVEEPFDACTDWQNIVSSVPK